MASIFEKVLNSLDGLSEAYSANIAEPSKLLKLVQDNVREEGSLVHTFESGTPLPLGFTLSAIDGANASEQLATGDLMIAAATVAEGLGEYKVYGEEEAPSEVFTTILPHRSANSKIEQMMRSLLELRVLANTKTRLRIIDGSYLGNVSNVLYGLINNDHKVSNTLLQHEVFSGDKLLEKAFQEILYPKRGTDNLIIGIPKSDSSTVYVDKFFEDLGQENRGFTDRLFASSMLAPGEFLKPRNIESNPGLISTLEKTLTQKDFGSKSFDRFNLMNLVSDKAGLFRRLGLSSTEEGLLWTTYFKPSKWNISSPAVRIEFLFYANDSDLTVEEKAAELISLLDTDFLDGVLEPWCQYAVDREAKSVSQALTATREFLISQTDDAHSAMGLLRGYRT